MFSRKLLTCYKPGRSKTCFFRPESHGGQITHPATATATATAPPPPLAVAVAVDLAPLGFRSKKQGFRTAWLITGQKFPWKNLKLGSSLLTFRDLSSHICEIILWVAKSGILDPGKGGISKTSCFFCGFLKNGTRTFFQNLKFPKYHVPAIQKMLILS